MRTHAAPALPTAALVLAIAAAPAGAQSFDEAVRANLTLALQLCLAQTGSTQATVNAFAAAGFAYSWRGTPGVDIWHQFAAPAGTVTAELYDGQMAPNCDVMSNHIGTGAAVPLVGALLAQLYPGRFVMEQREGPACASFTDTAPAIPFVVHVSGGGETRPCAETGTLHISTFSAV